MGVSVLVLGTITSREQSAFLLSHGVRPAPADIVQEYLIKGLENDKRVNRVHAVCSPRIQSCVKNRILKITDCQFEIARCEIESKGFLNFPGLGFIHREMKIVNSAKKWAKEQKDSNDALLVILYSMHSPFLRAASEIKRIVPNAVVAMIVPDLPQFMGKKNRIKALLKGIDKKRIESFLPIIDKYVLYTKHMAEYFGLSEDKWIVCEGLIDTDKINLCEKKLESNICVYAGSLLNKYAIDVLVDAFEELPLDYSLHLYGDASDAEILLKNRENYKKVKFKGLLPQKEIFEVMKQAKLLINPRPSTLELAKYSCPSKTFEYMASGTPVLMTRLPGLPEEYYPYLFFFDDETKSGFRDKLIEVLSLSPYELRDKGRNAAEYLKKNKTSDIQVSKILDFCYENRR